MGQIEVGLRLVFAALSLVVGVLCAVMAWQFNSMDWDRPVTSPFAFVEVLQSRGLREPDPQTSVAFLQRADEAGPRRASTQAYLAYAYLKADKAISPRVVGALRTSYERMPLAPDTHEPRLRLILKHWDAMPSDVRSSAVYELNQYLRRGYGVSSMRKFSQTLKGSGRSVVEISLLKAQIDQRLRQKALMEAQQSRASAS